MFRLFSPKCSLCLLYEVLLKTSIYSGFTSIYNRFVPYFPMFFPHVSHRFVRKKIQRFDVKAPSIVVHFISFPHFPMVFPHFPQFPLVFPTATALTTVASKRRAGSRARSSKATSHGEGSAAKASLEFVNWDDDINPIN